MRILFVCTGNVCRSPLAERLAGAWAYKALGGHAASIVLRSSGTNAPQGASMDESSARELRGLGGDPEGAFAQQLLPGEAESMDLVLTMTRRHRQKVLKGAPRALRRTFTLPEAADLLGYTNLAGVDRLPLADRGRELEGRLNDARYLRTAKPDDDVRDPIGQSEQVHKEVADHIATTLLPVCQVLFAPVRVSPTVPPRHRDAEATGHLGAQDMRILPRNAVL